MSQAYEELRHRIAALEEENARLREEHQVACRRVVELLGGARPTWNPVVLARAVLDALRNAGHIDSFDVYDLAEKSGLVERVPYDPEKHGTISLEGGETFEDLGTKPGDEIWILTAAGREVTAATKEQEGPNA